MASQGDASISRLSRMQMKFQQKQLQEREQRKVEMISEGGDSNDMNFPSKPFGNGKVRQMFDERRRGPGIDRSNPLKPILTKAKSSIINSTNAVQTRSNAPVIERRQGTLNDRKMNGRRNMVRNEVFEGGNTKSIVDVLNRSVNGMTRRAYEPNCMPDDDRFSKTFSSMSLREKRASPNEMADRNNNGNNIRKGDFARIQSSQSIKLQPVITKKSPPAFRADTYSTSPREIQTPIVKKQTSLKSSIGKPKRTTVGKTSSNSQRPPTGMAICRICHRNFNEDRLAKHEEVCQKLANSKRKIFDASKARIKGTEAEQYFKKPIRAAASNRPTMRYSSTAAASGMTLPTKPNNWRKKHEEFIAAIRAAKQVQLHIARGGKLSDLPPPPPSENPDYIQCPHCLRRFNEAAAERHIPKCATMVHNKPKPVASTNKRRN